MDRLGVNKRIAVLVVGAVALLTAFATRVAWLELSSTGVAAGEADGPSKSVAQRIDINTASVRELERLPGMGPEVVERILQNRPYRKLDELITKKVLGRKQFARIKDRIRVGSPSNRSVSQ